MTNKTDKNSNETRSWTGAQSKIEQLSTDTNPPEKPSKYRVQLFWRHTDVLFLTITARSLAEAENRAHRITSDDLPDDSRSGFDGEIYIDSVTELTEGQSHE